MSRIAKQPIDVPKGVEVKIDGQDVTVKGTKGTLSLALHDRVGLQQDDGVLNIIPRSEAANDRAMAGTMRSLVNNMVIGVSTGFERRLRLVGVGYRAQTQGQALNLTLGYSHPIDFTVPEGVKVETPSQTEIVVSGMDKQQVGQVAAKIRAFRPPEPYKGKGVRYTDEMIILKEAKKEVTAMDKKAARSRRGRRLRIKLRELNANRLCVHRTPRHIYAQIIAPGGDKVLATASTQDKNLREQLQSTGNIDAAKAVGQLIAEKAAAAGIKTVSFDRSGFKYHGRVKALAEAARESGLQF